MRDLGRVVGVVEDGDACGPPSCRAGSRSALTSVSTTRPSGSVKRTTGTSRRLRPGAVPAALGDLGRGSARRGRGSATAAIRRADAARRSTARRRPETSTAGTPPCGGLAGVAGRASKGAGPDASREEEARRPQEEAGASSLTRFCAARPRAAPPRPDRPRRWSGSPCSSVSSSISTGTAGASGSQAVEGLRWLLGAGHYLVPVALLGAGVILMLRPVLPAVRPFRSGAICLFLAVTLGPVGRDDRAGRRASVVVGRGVGQDPRRDGGGDARLGRRDAARLRRRAPAGRLPVHRGRAAGDRRVGRGRDQVHVGLGVLDHARAARGGQDARAQAPSAAGRRPRDARALHARAGEGGAARAGRDRRAARVRVAVGRGARDRGCRAAGARSIPSPSPRRCPELDGLAEDPAEDEPGVTRGPAEPVSEEQLTPQGRYRSEVTDSPDFVWELPGSRRALTRSTEDASRPDTVGQEKVAAALLEALGHFNIEARVIGMVVRPAHHALRAAARAGHQGRQGRAAQGRPRVRAGRGRHPHPGADPGQAGGRHRGAQRAPPDRAPRRHLPGAAARTGRR